MTATFFPGFEPPAEAVLGETVVTIRPVARPSTPPVRAAVVSPNAAPAHVQALTQRVQWFHRTLPDARRAEISRRPRFHTLPWLRRSTQ